MAKKVLTSVECTQNPSMYQESDTKMKSAIAKESPDMVRKKNNNNNKIERSFDVKSVTSTLTNKPSKSEGIKSADKSFLVGDSKKLDPTLDSSYGPIVNGIPKLLKEEAKSTQEAVSVSEFFHGFICREDLAPLLKKFGDFLIRISIREDKTEALKKTERRGSKHVTLKSAEKLVPPHVGREYVISVFCREKPGNYSGKGKRSLIRNLAIRRIDGKFCIETSKKFRTINELLANYKKEIGTYKMMEFQLLNGVGLSNWEFKHENVKLTDKKLGEGAFGEVLVGEIKCKGEEKITQVAVKMLKNAECVTREQVAELLHEGRVMRLLDHKNVLRSYGFAILHEPLYLMSEMCGNGALREYLREHAKTITPADRIDFCLGSARGVEYLHSQNIIHRDLAVRNVLLTEDKIPKVSDFGLAKITDCYKMKEQCKIPVRYLSPETLETYVFTAKSDVFSFGMVIWEIYENGTQPHDGKNGQTIREITKKRKFLKLNPLAPEPLRKCVSEKIFVSDPENRCNMSVIVQTLEKLVIK